MCELNISVLLMTSYLMEQEVLVALAVWYNTGRTEMQRDRGLMLLLQ